MVDWVATKAPAVNGQALQVKIQGYVGRNHVMQNIGIFASVYETDGTVDYVRGSIPPEGKLEIRACKAFLLNTKSPLTVAVTPDDGTPFNVKVSRTFFIDEPASIEIVNTSQTDTAHLFYAAACLP